MEWSSERLKSALREYFGFDLFKEGQEEIVRSLLEGNDTFVLMPTGGGKSLCYQLPALLLEGTAIIISPLIALMKNQVDAIRGIHGEDSIAHFIISSLSKGQMEEIKKDVLQGKTKMLYIAPESLKTKNIAEFLKDVNISFYAVDEAHCISEWGHDFRQEYGLIRQNIDVICKDRPVIALTATATPTVAKDILTNLHIQDAKVFSSSFNRENLLYQIRPKDKDIDRDIIKFILENKGKSGIVYCMSRNKVTTFAEVLQVNGIKAKPYHAGLEPQDRVAHQDAFLSEEIDVIVATIAFGMGIDKPDVRYVIHYDMPKSLEAYYQETGRAGRDGGEGVCIAYYTPKDIRKMETLLKTKTLSEQEVARQLIRETSDYAQSNICRRKFLLNYFGEEYEKENCKCCDNCLSPKKKVEAKKLLLDLIEVVETLKSKFDSDHVVKVLCGKESSAIKNYGHNELECFGLGEEYDEEVWTNVIRQAIIDGYFSKQVDDMGILKLSAKGKKYPKKPTSFEIVMPDDEEDADVVKEASSPSGGGVTDDTIFKMMKALRKKLGTKHNVPPYVIFQDSSLEAMAAFYPITMEELQNIPGVGAGKATRYGKEFLALIKQYVEDNEIERPEDLRIRSVPQKNKLKITIIQQIDRKVALDDMAEALGIDFFDLLSEVESIVYSGTRINISYFIDEVVDEDHIEDIYEYFRESTTDSIDAAMDELGNDYPEEEIRLIRIKFISELAN